MLTEHKNHVSNSKNCAFTENNNLLENIANKIEVKIGSRVEGKIEILSGLNQGDLIVAEGLKKVYPRAKINPIKEGQEKSTSSWKKKKIKRPQKRQNMSKFHRKAQSEPPEIKLLKKRRLKRSSFADDSTPENQTNQRYRKHN